MPHAKRCAPVRSSWFPPTPSTAWRPCPTAPRRSTGSTWPRIGPRICPCPCWQPRWRQVRQLGVEFPATATILSARWWPGPLTMAFGFSAGSTRPPWLIGREEVAVRIPAKDFLLALMEDTGVLLVTSANRHGEPTSTSAGEAGSQVAPHVGPRHRCRNPHGGALHAGQRARQCRSGRARGRDQRRGRRRRALDRSA